MRRIETWICFAIAVVLILFSYTAHGDSYFRKATVGIAPVVTVYESADTLYIDTDMTDLISVGDEVKVVSKLDSLSIEQFTVTAITSAKIDIDDTWDHPTITDGRLELVGPQLTVFDDSKTVAFRVDKQPMFPLRSAFPDTTGYIGGEMWMSTTGDSLYFYKSDHTITSLERIIASADQTIAAGTTITVATGISRVVSDGGAVTVTADPTLAAGTYDGQEITIQGTHDTNTVTIQDEANNPGSTLELEGNANFTFGLRDTMDLVWYASQAKWCEKGRSDN